MRFSTQMLNKFAFHTLSEDATGTNDETSPNKLIALVKNHKLVESIYKYNNAFLFVPPN